MMHNGRLDRSLAPGMFTSHYIQSMCEILMLQEQDFERLLLEPALEDLRRRLDLLRSCGIFSKWTAKQHVRLVRMGQIRRYSRGETILTQGSKPNYLYIVMKGICKVQKQPNRTEMLVQKLSVARERADTFDSKYIFHSKLRDVLAMANPKEEFKSTDGVENATVLDARKNADSIMRQRYVTSSELDRYKLQMEINKLEALIQNAAQQDEIEDLGGGFGGASCKRAHAEAVPVLELKVADIATLQWPRIFGEACITDPEDGKSRGSIIADTAVELFLLHKTQIQTFPVDDSFLQFVKTKAVSYPGDPDVVVALFRQQNWRKYRQGVMEAIPKQRWPSSDKDMKETFRIA